MVEEAGAAYGKIFASIIYMIMFVGGGGERFDVIKIKPHYLKKINC